MATYKEFVFTQDFGFIQAGRKIKEDINGHYFLSATDEEVIAGTLPWIGAVRFNKEYIKTLPFGLLAPV